MRIGGVWGAASALAGGATRAGGAVYRQITRGMRTPAFGVAVITPLVLAGAVGGAAPRATPPVRDTAVTPLAAVAPHPKPTGPTVVSVSRPHTSFRVAAASTSAPPPAIVVSSPGMLGIPGMALSAYRNAEQQMAAAAPDCGISWNLLAGIGRIESMHANNGATDASGTAVRPIYGPSLDGTLPGNEVIVQSRTTNRVMYARAMGPMQFLPGTWARYAADGDGDGQANPQNLYDSTLSAARYLCSGGLNLRDQSQVLSAILRYNNSMPYARNVLGWAAAYATGVVPVDLPPITGPPPPIGDAHLEHPEGLGPAMPFNHNGHSGLPTTDPLTRMPLIDLGPSSAVPGPFVGRPAPPGQWPWQPPELLPAPPPRSPTCSVICIEPQAPPPAGAPPEAMPPPDAAPPPGAPTGPPPGAPTGPPPGGTIN